MPCNFQFAFLGFQHNYLARVTSTSNDGVPQADSLIATYGLPSSFVEKMTSNKHRSRAYYDICGHDFLSHSGHWTGTRGVDDVGYVGPAFVPISESSVLKDLSLENEQHGSARRRKTKSKYSGLSMIICLGPKLGHVFVDAYKLKRYQWNLPSDIHFVLQGLTSNAYEKCGIYDVQMNALGGWVILLDRGRNFRFGGELPYELRILLQDVEKRKRATPNLDTTIYVPDILKSPAPRRYVLIFGDGECYVKLHSQFEEDIRTLLTAWDKNTPLNPSGKSTHPKFDIHFESSSTTGKESQKVINAAYYSRRGLFFLSRLNEPQALLYLREASSLDPRSSQIRESYCMAILGRLSAMRRDQELDFDLEEMIANRPARTTTHRLPPPRINQDEKTFFKAEYMWMLEEQDINLGELAKKLDALQRSYLDQKWHLTPSGGVSEHEWSYDKAIQGNENLDLPELETVEVDPNAPVEAPAEEVVVDRIVPGVSEMSSSMDEVDRFKEVVVEPPGRTRIVLDPPEFERVRGKGLFAKVRKLLN